MIRLATNVIVSTSMMAAAITPARPAIDAMTD
jgi:hypothetical protein